ncbi:cobalamin-binding protein [Dorea formicigenerans]|jgi:dimethylamine corrinoid protein|uniref:Cobalamin-binding protein n=1 Tax=Dorea formicigenerans TaxID=39486 RepID=A0A395XT33_9FIRM|nr:cobalamin-binding protein [Dorea formicigenerans]
MADKQILLSQMAEAVVDMDEDLVEEAATEYVNAGHDALEGITSGLSAGMEEVGHLYEEQEYYIPELLICSEVMYKGMDILRPHLNKVSTDDKVKLKAVVGVVEGDTHDIGKNLFKIMLETQGFEVFDLGRDVPPDQFIDKAKEVGANLIGMSTLMTTTMRNMEVTIEKLKEAGIRDSIVVMVGGGPISHDFAMKIGADGYEAEASRAAETAKQLVMKKCYA